jgi:hypothetical protein
MDGNKFSIIFFYYLNIKYFISFEEEFETLKQNIIEELNIELKEGEKLEIYSYYNELISNQNEYNEYIKNLNLKELILNIKLIKGNEKIVNEKEEISFRNNNFNYSSNPLFMSDIIETITDMDEIRKRQKELE